MYKVSIVDDDKEAMDRLEDLLKNYTKRRGVEFDVNKYDKPEEYLNERDVDSHLIFLDVKMPRMDGLSLARKIREDRPNVIIIFCTGFQRFAINGYEVSAFAFLIKPIVESQLEAYLDKAVMKLQGEGIEKVTSIKTMDGVRVLRVMDVVYVEVSQHHVYYHVKSKKKEEGKVNEEVIQARGSLREIEDELAPYGFYRCSISYLVNLNLITSIKGGMVHFATKSALSISRGYRKIFTERFMEFISKKGSDF